MTSTRELAEKILGECLREQTPSDEMVKFVESLLKEALESEYQRGCETGTDNLRNWGKKIREAVDQEREECAKMFEYAGDTIFTANQIVDLIRRREER